MKVSPLRATKQKRGKTPKLNVPAMRKKFARVDLISGAGVRFAMISNAR